MDFLIFPLFGFGGLAAYWTYCSFTNRDFDTGQRESFNEAEDLEDFDDVDLIKRAYDRGDIDDFKLQQLYDDGIIDEEEAESISTDTIDFDDDDF